MGGTLFIQTIREADQLLARRVPRRVATPASVGVRLVFLVIDMQLLIGGRTCNRLTGRDTIQTHKLP